MDITAFCTQSSVLVVAGKGGVGKSTVSATLARLAARNGLSVLLVELEGRGGPSATFGHRALTSDEVEPSSAGTGDRSPRSAPIGTRTITPDEALVEYLVDHGFRRVARRLAKSGMLDVVATALPGVRDILVLGKIVQLERAGAPDLIVVDGPAAGHGTAFLTSAQGLLDSSRAGPIRALAADAVGLLCDPTRCQVVLVTLAEETPVNETVETAFDLEDRVGTHLGPVIVNDFHPRFDNLNADPEDAAAAAGVTLPPGQAHAMRAAATFSYHRQKMQFDQAARLAEALPLPQLWLPHLYTEEIGLPEIDLLVDYLEKELVDLSDPPSRASWTGPTEPAAGNRVPRRAAAGKGRWS
jgi:anion-transporting  ArsA/GET3 family ATPase